MEPVLPTRRRRRRLRLRLPALGTVMVTATATATGTGVEGVGEGCFARLGWEGTAEAAELAEGETVVAAAAAARAVAVAVAVEPKAVIRASVKSDLILRWYLGVGRPGSPFVEVPGHDE